jgi:hypothetical protein
LLQALLDAAERHGILIMRQYELQSFSRENNESKTKAVFTNNNKEQEVIPCGLLLLACGNKAIKEILGTHHRLPVELHYTNVLGARIPIDHKNFGHTHTSAIALYPDFNYLSMVVAQLAAYYLMYCPKSVGSFSVYLASLNKFVMLSTYPPEYHQEFKSNANSRKNFLRERIK